MLKLDVRSCCVFTIGRISEYQSWEGLRWPSLPVSLLSSVRHRSQERGCHLLQGTCLVGGGAGTCTFLPNLSPSSFLPFVSCLTCVVIYPRLPYNKRSPSLRVTRPRRLAPFPCTLFCESFILAQAQTQLAEQSGNQNCLPTL